MADEQLIGTWKLVSYQARGEDGRVSYPVGQDPVGYIIYTQDGYMSVSIMSADRPRYSSTDLLGGTDEEKVAAATTYIGYCGRYEFDANRVLHHIEVAFFPNRTGTSQERFVELAGDRLSLVTPPMLIKGEERTAYLVWERAVKPQSSQAG